MTILKSARAALSGIMPEGWSLTEAPRRGERTVELHLHPPLREGLGVGIEWTEDEGPAFARGTRYGASYRRGPGLVDLGDPEAPEALRRLAHAACKALADLREGPSLTLKTPRLEPLEGDPIEVALEVLPGALNEAFDRGALSAQGDWHLVEVKAMTRWVRVAEAVLACEGKSLTMIFSPSDPERPAFRRGQRYDLIYYSDDLPVSEHGALYERDRAMIDAFGAWFGLWDR